jgi:plasmid replication initiation protein
MTFTGRQTVDKSAATKEIKKPVEAIQCANTFSLLQRKMYNVLLANAAGNLYPDMTHRIAMRILCTLMDYRSNDYKTIKQKFRELRRMDIEWDIINENGNKVWTNTSPLSLARVIEGEGICEYEFTPSLIPYLDRPAQYAKFSLAIQAKFKSSYGLALYENCERYRNIGYTRAFDIPTFRKLMGINPSEYLNFFALKRRVINIAVKEINQYADFDIEPEYEKQGRSVISIKFFIVHKQALALSPLPSSIGHADKEDKLVEKLKDCFGLKQKDINKYLKKYDREYIEEKVNSVLNSDSFNNGLIKSMAGYLKTALSEDYQTAVSSKTVVEKQRREREVMLSLQREQEEKLNELKRGYKYYLSKEICKLMSNMAEDIKCQIFTEFEQCLAGGYLDVFRREGLDNLLIADRFVEFVRQRQPEILNAVISLEDYLKKLSANV